MLLKWEVQAANDRARRAWCARGSLNAVIGDCNKAFDPADAESVRQDPEFMCECLDKICADANAPGGAPVPWRECLPPALLDCAEPPLAAYLKEWWSPDACNEAYV